ncbi:MAG: IS3 family transposase [Myxococcales bacterium]|nr:IS3 family transposase [Myxococcales bacterium]MCB9606217.1 IS3 family transposase [Polyangiaceae bacterium]
MYGLIHAERGNIPVARACRVLQVSRSGYYQWLHAKPSTRSLDDAVLGAEITEVFHEHRGRYGAPRVRRALRPRGKRPSKKRVARVMRALGLRGYTPRRFRKTTDSRHTKRIAPNLLERDFTAEAPNQVLAGDITYISTTDGWLYLAVLLDLYSRRVVGWAMSDHIDTELALSALNRAASTRTLEPNWIHHTDRDCRYGSDDYLAALEQLGARPSMSRKGDCWDNAVSESFFATLEKELLALQPLQSRSTTRKQVADYIDNYYNLVRLHSHLDYVSPIEFETNAPS